MSEQFDPYLVWLGIRDPQRPPTYYRLLGVDLFEEDPLVISNAADRQMAHVRTFQTGKHAQLSQQILNEISNAKLSLLNPQRKAEYDASLRQMGFGAQVAPPPPPTSTPPQAYAQQPQYAQAQQSAYPQQQYAQQQPIQAAAVQGAQPSRATSSRSSSRGSGIMIFGLLGLTVAAAFGIMIALFSAEQEENPDNVTEVDLGQKQSKEPATKNEQPPASGTPDSTNTPDPSQPQPSDPEPEPKREGAWPTQDGPVFSTAFSPTGKTALSVGQDGRLRIWKVSAGETLFDLPAHSGGTYCVSLFSNGQMAATGGADQTLRIWSLETNEELFALSGHSKAIRAVDVDEEGQWAVTASDDGSVKLWDLTTKKEVLTYINSIAPMRTVGLDVRNKWVAAAGEEGIVRVWDLESGSRLVDYRASEQAVRQLALAWRGQRMLVASEDLQLSLYKVEPGRDPELLRQWPHASAVTATGFSPNRECAISGSASGDVRLWTGSGSEPVASWKLADSPILNVTISPAGDLALATDAAGHIQTWKLTPEQTKLVLEKSDPTATPVDAPPSELVRTWDAHTDWIREVTFSPNGQQIASVGDDGRVLLWDAGEEASEAKQVTQLPGRTTQVAFSPEGEFLAIGTSEGMVHIWDVANQREVKSTPLSSPVTFLAFRSREELLCAEANRLVYHWEWTSSDPPDGLALGGYGDRWLPGPSGEMLSASLDAHLRAWDLSAEENPLQRTMPVEKPLASLASRPEGRWLFAGDTEGRVHIVANQNQVEPMATLRGHTGPVWAMTATPGLAISGGHDKTIKFWDLQSPEAYRVLEGHRGVISSLAVSPDAKLLVSADRSGEMRLWKLPSVPASEPSGNLANASQMPRHPIPEKPMVEEAKRKLRAQYAAQYGQRNHDVMVQLANTFLSEAAVQEMGVLERYAMLDEARLISIQEGDVSRALQAAKEMAERYEHGLLAWQADTLEEITTNARSLQYTGTAKNASIQLVKLMDEALAANKYPVAQQLGKAGNGLATRLKSRAFAFMMQQMNRTIADEQRKYETVERAEEQLAASPGDPASHLAIGRFYALVKEDWEQGLPHLALGENTDLRRIAWQELEQPETGEKKYQLAQAWKAFGSGAESEKLAPLKRALHWYREAQTDLDDLTRQEADAAKEAVYQQLEKLTVVYLADLPPLQTTGPVDGSGKVVVNSQRPPKSILVGPNQEDEVAIRYLLFKKFSTFRAIVAVPDNAKLRGEVTFRVYGDGQELWQSDDLSVPGQQQSAEVNISGVHELTIHVRTRYDRRYLPLGAWVTPQLSPLKRQDPVLDFESFGE